MVDMLQNLRYGHHFLLRLQPVRQNARKKINFEICQNKNWVRRPKYIAPTSTFGFQKEVDLLKIPKLGDLYLNITFRLWNFIETTWSTFCGVDKCQELYFYIVSETM